MSEKCGGGSQSAALVPADWAAQLLHFWFDAHGQDDWFGGGPAFNEAISSLAGDWLVALRDKAAGDFLTDPGTALAATLLFDQVPRNLFRGQARAYATDTLALVIARGIIERGWDRAWSADRRKFAYMPFEHSENIADQHRSLRLFGDLGDTATLDYAQKHFDIVARFGRFPHRNAALGRVTRPDEGVAVQEGRNW